MATKGLLFVMALGLLMCSLPGMADDAAKSAAKTGWDDAWSWGNAMVVKSHFESLYYPHAAALLSAEQKLNSGASPVEILVALKTLPGIRGAAVLKKDGKSQQWPASLTELDKFAAEVFASREATGVYKAPMMHRTVGGQARFLQAAGKDGPLDLLVRYVRADTAAPSAAVCIALDKTWLTQRVPQAMDSLYRENPQLLFCAASPQNKFWEQSLGVIAGKDTLWWVGSKNVKVTNTQILWPFESIQIPSYVHSLEKK